LYHPRRSKVFVQGICPGLHAEKKGVCTVAGSSTSPVSAPAFRRRSGQGAHKYSSWHATPASRQTPALGRRALDVRAHEIVQLSVPGWRTRQACQLPTSIHGKPGWAAATAAAVAATARDQPRQAQQGPGHAGACHPGHCAGVPRAGMLPG